jgi:hypothetical protein
MICEIENNGKNSCRNSIGTAILLNFIAPILKLLCLFPMTQLWLPPVQQGLLIQLFLVRISPAFPIAAAVAKSETLILLNILEQLGIGLNHYIK